jgi:hypothetical protein
MTPASWQALEGLRDRSMRRWCVIPPIGHSFFICTLEEESVP